MAWHWTAARCQGNESWNNPDIVYWLSGQRHGARRGDTLTVGAGPDRQGPTLRPDDLIVNGTLKPRGRRRIPSSSPPTATTPGGDTNNDGAK